MKTIAIANQKGGVGKTTTGVHLACGLKEKGKRVLFIDLDPQANSTKTLAKMGAVSYLQASSLFSDKTEISLDHNSDQITYIPADALMADMERSNPEVLIAFKRNLIALGNAFDFCIIDTPPTLGLRMSAALISAQFVLSPIELEEYSIDGITKMLQTIFGVKEKWNKELQFLGMLPNRFNPRSLAQKDTLSQLLQNYSHMIIPAKIGIRSSIPEALSEGIPVWQLKKTSAREAAKEFQEALEIIYNKMGGI